MTVMEAHVEPADPDELRFAQLREQLKAEILAELRPDIPEVDHRPLTVTCDDQTCQQYGVAVVVQVPDLKGRTDVAWTGVVCGAPHRRGGACGRQLHTP